MAKNILIPIYVSNLNHPTIPFAIQFAERFDWTLHFLFFVRQENELSGAYARMESWLKEQERKFPELQVAAECVYGNYRESILNQVAIKDAELIIIPSAESEEIKELSTKESLVSLIRDCTLPVIAVPDTYEPQSPKRGGLLTNFHPQEVDTIKLMLEITGEKMPLTCLHIYTDEPSEEIEKKLDEWKISVMGNLNAEEIDFVKFRAKNILAGIEDVTKIYDLDLIGVTSHSKSVLTKLFKKDLLEHLLRYTHIPIVFVKCNNYNE